MAGAPPAIDLGAEKRLIECLVKLASERAILSAHDASDGGIAVTIAESCFASEGLAADVDLGAADEPAESALFGERGARAVVSLARGSLARASELAAQCNVKVQAIGRVTRGEFRIQYRGAPVIQGSVDSFRRMWSELLAKAIEDKSWRKLVGWGHWIVGACFIFLSASALWDMFASIPADLHNDPRMLLTLSFLGPLDVRSWRHVHGEF